MIVITIKENNNVVGIAEDMHNGERNLYYWDNGYPAIKSTKEAWISEQVDVYQNVDNVPDDKYLKAGKYKYTSEDGFTINSDWVAPDETNTYGIPDEVLAKIRQDTLDSIVSEVNA